MAVRWFTYKISNFSKREIKKFVSDAPYQLFIFEHEGRNALKIYSIIKELFCIFKFALIVQGWLVVDAVNFCNRNGR